MPRLAPSAPQELPPKSLVNPHGRQPPLLLQPRPRHSQTRGPLRTAPRPRKPQAHPSARPRASRGAPALPRWPPGHRHPPCGLTRPRSPRRPRCYHCQYLPPPSSSAAQVRHSPGPRTRPARQPGGRFQRRRRRRRRRPHRRAPLPPHSPCDAPSCRLHLPLAPRVPNGPGRVRAFCLLRGASEAALTALGGRSLAGWSYEAAYEVYGPRLSPTPPRLTLSLHHCARRHHW